MTDRFINPENMSMDKFWSQYLDDTGEIRENIHLQILGSRELSIAFQKKVVNMFEEFIRETEKESVSIFQTMEIMGSDIEIREGRLRILSSTWTYQINDNPFDILFGMRGISKSYRIEL